MATMECIDAVFALLSRTYPDHIIRYKVIGQEAVETMRLYGQILGDIPDQALQAAAVDHAASSQWFPKPSELRERAFAIMRAEQPTAYDAWGWVCAYVDHGGQRTAAGKAFRAWRVPEIIERAVRAIGGWARVRDGEDTASDRARFVEAYTMMVRREQLMAQEVPMVREAKRLAVQMVIGDEA